MRNWRPYIPDVVKQMRADGVEEAAVLCLAPQNSRTSVGLYERAVQAEAGGCASTLPRAGPTIRCWPRPSPSASGRRSQARRRNRRASARAVHRAQRAHAHRQPQPAADSGPRLWPGEGVDPYAEEARHTAALVAARVPEIPRWGFAFQSQGASGGPWIGPTVEETLDAIAAEGVTTLLLQPIGFLCDHVEILYDVDIAFKQYASKAGIRLERPESLNASRTLASAIANLAQSALDRLRG